MEESKEYLDIFKKKVFGWVIAGILTVVGIQAFSIYNSPENLSKYKINHKTLHDEMKSIDRIDALKHSYVHKHIDLEIKKINKYIDEDRKFKKQLVKDKDEDTKILKAILKIVE